MQTHHLVMEIAGSKFLRFKSIDATVTIHFRKAAVVLPLPLATETHEGKHAQAVTEVVHRIVLAPHVLEAYEVQVHILHVADLAGDGFGSIQKEDIISPASAFQQDVLPIEGKLAVTILSEPALDLAYSEGGFTCVRQRSSFFYLH